MVTRSAIGANHTSKIIATDLLQPMVNWLDSHISAQITDHLVWVVIEFFAGGIVIFGLYRGGQLLNRHASRRFKSIISNVVVPTSCLLVTGSVTVIAALLPNAPDHFWQYTVMAGMLATFMPVIYGDISRNFTSITEHGEQTRNIVERSLALILSVRPLFDKALNILKAHEQKIATDFFGAFRTRGSGALRDEAICLAIYSEKFDEICKQLARQELYLRRERFQTVWDSLTSGVEYQSICDLSSYSRLRLAATDSFDDYYDSLSQSWERRIRHELETLDKHKGTFQKVLVYSPPAKCATSTPPPCYEPGGKCAYLRCPVEEKCIVKPIAEQWALAAGALKAKRPPAAHGASQWSICLMPREKVERRVRNLNREFEQLGFGQHGLDSIDIGLFGNAFLGEEFKVPVELDDRQHVMKDYLYRIRYNSQLVSDVRALFNQTVLDGAIGVA